MTRTGDESLKGIDMDQNSPRSFLVQEGGMGLLAIRLVLRYQHVSEELGHFSRYILFSINYFLRIFNPLGRHGPLIVFMDTCHRLSSKKADILIENSIAEVIYNLPKHEGFDHGL